MRRLLWFIGVSMLIGVIFVPAILLKEAWGVPSFSRQTGMGCNQCHTVWPRLTPVGRAFKLGAYTMTTKSTIKDSFLDIPEVLPVSVRAKNYVYSKKDAGNDENIIPEEFAIFLAGRVSPNVGYFAEPVWEDGEWELETMKIAAFKELGDNIFGAFVGRMEPAGGDPYSTLTLLRRPTRHRNEIFGITRKSKYFYFGSTENLGGVLYGSVKGRLYLSSGVFRGFTEKAGAVENKSRGSDNADVYGRAALNVFPLPSLKGKGDLTIGAYIYSGRENLEKSSGAEYDDNVKRLGVDLNYQVQAGDHLFELLGATVDGRDGNNGSQLEVDHWGWSLEGSYFYKRKYGLIANLESTGSRQDKDLERRSATLNATYLPWQNVKIAAEYTNYLRFKTKTGDAAQDENLFTLILDLVF